MRKSFIRHINNNNTSNPNEPVPRTASGGGMGPLSFGAFKVPSSTNSRLRTTRKRTRVVYAEPGGFYEDDENDKDHDPHAEKKAKKAEAAAAKKRAGGGSDSDEGPKKSKGGFVDRYVEPPAPKEFPVFRPRPFEAVVGSSFRLPGIKRKGRILDYKLTGRALGTRQSGVTIPRPLHNPLQDHAIVLWDPTVDDREAERELERERLLKIEQDKDKVGTKALDEAEIARSKVHRSLAEMLGLVDRNGPRKILKVPVVVDPRLSKVLRPHQVAGVQFLYKCVTGMTDERAFGCIMADEMGLGKTLQCISLLWTLLKQSPISNKQTIDKIIVVCPSSLVRNWANELIKWLGEGAVAPLPIDGKIAPADLIPLIRQWCASKGRNVVTPVIIVSYEKLRLLTDELGTTEIGLLLADEGHRLKNSTNQTYTALMQINCKRRVILTGTPIQNDLDEYYSLLNFCNPGYLGTKTDFHKKFETPICRGRDGDATDNQKTVGDAALKDLNQLVQKFIIRRTNDLLTKYLPVKYEHVVFCALAPFQQALYTHFINSPECQAVLKGKDARPLASIMMLRKLCCHPDLNNLEQELPGCRDLFPDGYDPKDRRQKINSALSGKMIVLDRFLERMIRESDDKLVLVSNMTATLDLFEKLLNDRRIKWLRLDGTMNPAKRQKLVDQFNDPENPARVFLLSSKAGGCGINLVGANRLILFDPDWNPASDMQALARVWRDGQKKNCFVYRFVATGTVEEKIFQRQSHKQNLSSCVVDEKQDIERHYTGESLRQLFQLNDSLCQTHDLFKCKRCKGGKQTVKSPAMLYGDTSTWNHLTNACLATIHDDLLRAECGLDSVTACFQFIST